MGREFLLCYTTLTFCVVITIVVRPMVLRVYTGPYSSPHFISCTWGLEWNVFIVHVDRPQVRCTHCLAGIVFPHSQWPGGPGGSGGLGERHRMVRVVRAAIARRI